MPLDPWIFLISFGIGMMIAYVATPPPQVIIRFPTVENAGKVIYKDDAGVCYRYKAKQINCPEDPNKIFRPPLQVVDEEEMSKRSSMIHAFRNMQNWWNERTTTLQKSDE
jgi:hypothetical protein